MNIAALPGRILVSEHAPPAWSEWYIKMYAFDPGHTWGIFVSSDPKKSTQHTIHVNNEHIPQALQDLINGCVERGLGQPVVDWCEERGDELWRLLFTDTAAFVTTYRAMRDGILPA